MPLTDDFDNVMFEEAKEKCAFYGVKFSKNDFISNPQKYCYFIDKYTLDLKDYIENNMQRLTDLQQKFSIDASTPKYMIMGKARLEMEKEFQQHLLSKLKPFEKTSDVSGRQEREAELEAQRLKEEERKRKREAELEAQRLKEEERKRKREAELEAQRLKEEERKKEREAELEAQRLRDEKLKKLKRIRQEQRLARREATIKKIKDNIENYKKTKEQEKAIRVDRRKEFIKKQADRFSGFSFEELKSKFVRAVKYAVVGIPVLGFSYMTYLGFKNPGLIDDDKGKNPDKELVTKPTRSKETSKSKDRIFNLNLKAKVESKIKENRTRTNNDSQQHLTDTLPKHKYKSISSSIPVLANDQLIQLPNVDLFNYCFNMSNEPLGKYTKYGVSRKMFNDFMSHNLSTARMNKISDYNHLSYTDYRIISKTVIYDTYGIGYIQNRSIAAYLYNTLQKQYTGNNYIGAVAQGVKDFYRDENKEISPSQQISIDRLIKNPYINIRDWRQLVALINKTSVNPDYESKLFSYIKDRVEDSGFEDRNDLRDENGRYTFEPTIKVSKFNNCNNTRSFLPDVSGYNYEKVYNALSQQKERDLEVFFNIYMQCSHQNYVNLKHGSSKKTYFNEANLALRNFGIHTSLHPTLYCAGMSMASFCQAAEIFKEENPDSFVNDALTDFINSCNNVHSCISLKNDLSLISSKVHRSYNLESDVKNYMKANDDAILFVWAPRASNRYHHQTLFPKAETNNCDSYTYCAFNNQHWGNESTFARYMRSRSQYGRSGYFADIKSIVDNFAEKSLDKAFSNARLSFVDEYALNNHIYYKNTLS